MKAHFCFNDFRFSGSKGSQGVKSTKKMPARTRSKKEKGAPVKGGGKGRQPYRRPAAATASEQPKGDATEAIQASNLPLCFWREIDPATGWLSQWYMCDFTDEDGVVYKSAEQYVLCRLPMDMQG